MIPIFFTDRDLGNLFPKQLAKAGIRVEKHSDHFAHDAKDEDWLTQVGRKGWFCLTHDKRIRYKPNEIDAVMRAGVGLFILIGNMTHQELATNFISTIHKVTRFIEANNRPFIAKIKGSTKKSSFVSSNRPGKVELWLSCDRWKSTL
ncbi:MAG: hypothetical protein PHT49_02690 [Desulfovibrionales bacterium]|nr:hypothetical protein [Desulfovibrionales bacterium]